MIRVIAYFIGTSVMLSIPAAALTAPAHVEKDLTRLPLAFERRPGPAGRSDEFVARGTGYRVAVSDEGAR